MRHVGDDSVPEGVYDEAEAAIVRYAQKATRLEAVDDVTYGNLARHFSTQQIMDICLTVGLSNTVNRFHATFLTDVDPETIAEAEAGDRLAGSCPIPRPRPPK